MRKFPIYLVFLTSILLPGRCLHPLGVPVQQDPKGTQASTAIRSTTTGSNGVQPVSQK